MKEQLPGLMKFLIAQHVHKVFKKIAWDQGVHEQKGGQEGLCQRTTPPPQWALCLTGLGSPPREVMVTSVWVGNHTQRKKEIGVVCVPQALTL